MDTVEKKVIYIMGHARSGSTILNILLGNSPDAMAAGETGNFYRSGLLNNEFCSCGQPFEQCEFWSPISRSMRQQLNGKIDAFISYSKSLDNWRNVLFSGRMSKDNLTTDWYHKVNRQLFEEIITASGKNTLIDASKDPVRFFHLRTLPQYKFALIHIVRDPRAVCLSQLRTFKKDMQSGLERDMQGKSIFKTVKSLYINTYLSEKMKRLHKHNVVTVNYDELAQGKGSALSDITLATGLDTTALAHSINKGEILHQFHSAAGNRLRMSREIRLMYDYSWRQSLTRLQYFTITLLTLPLILRYRFRL